MFTAAALPAKAHNSAAASPTVASTRSLHCRSQQVTSPPESTLQTQPGRTALLLAKAAITGSAGTEMEALCALLMARSGHLDRAVYVFSEQGTPSLREVLRGLADEGTTGAAGPEAG